jgi:hypothetical protein
VSGSRITCSYPGDNDFFTLYDKLTTISDIPQRDIMAVPIASDCLYFYIIPQLLSIQPFIRAFRKKNDAEKMT